MRYTCIRSILALAVLVALILPLSSYAKAKFGKISDEEWRIGPPEDYPEANAVVILDNGFIDVNTDRIKIERLVRLKVLTNAGIKEVGEQTISFHGDYDKLKDFKAHSITPDKKKHKVEKDAIFERTAGDYREKVFSFPQVHEGSILEYKYTIISKRFRFLKPWYFQGPLYTLQSNVAVRLLYGFDYNASFFNVPAKYRQPKKEEEININDPSNPLAGLVTYSWSLTNLPPIVDEPYRCAINDYRSCAKFQLLSWQNRSNYMTFVDTWELCGNEILEIWDAYLNKRGDIKKLALEITQGLSDPREKSRALYDYVKSNFKTSDDYYNWYFVHDKVGKLLEEKHGSAEAKNLVLVEMLNAAGIKAFPTLISTRSHGRVYSNNPDLRQFNHLLAYIEFGDGWDILDASNKANPYGTLSPNCLVQTALLVEKDASQLIRVPDMARSSKRTDLTTMIIDGTGNTVCSTVCDFSGYHATRYAERYEKKQLEDFVKDYFVERLGVVYNLGDYDCKLDSAGHLVTTMDFSSEDLAEQLDNNIIINPVCFAFASNPFEAEKRFFPVDFMYPFTHENIVKVLLPSNVDSYQVPGDTTFNIAGASFSRRSLARDSCITITTILKVDQPLYKPHQYRALRKFFEDIAVCSGDELLAVLDREDQ